MKFQSNWVHIKLFTKNTFGLLFARDILNHNRFCAFALASPRPQKGSLFPQCTKPIMVQYKFLQNPENLEKINSSHIFAPSMKIAINIFAFYLFALSLVPCGDGGGGIIEMAEYVFGAEQQVQADHQQHSDPCDGDLCSPFCICSCCSLTLDITEKTPLRVKAPASILKVKPSFVPNIFPSIYCTSFWQPPRFC